MKVIDVSHEPEVNIHLRLMRELAVENIQLDTTTIMMYSFPKEFTEDGFETAWNTGPSDQDKEMIRIMYPPG